jgi:hypothetical protein
MSTAELRQRLRAILLSEWDPLCVGENPNLADEYDRYMPALLALLQSDAGRAGIAEALERIEKEQIGMQSPSSGIERAATSIWLLRPR